MTEPRQPKYEIGDTLTLCADQTYTLFVVSRLTEECPGGVQYAYECRAFHPERGIHRDLVRYNEVELTQTKE